MPFKDKEQYKLYQQKYYQSKIKDPNSRSYKKSPKIINAEKAPSLNREYADEDLENDEDDIKNISMTDIPTISTDYLNIYSKPPPTKPNPFGTYNHYQPRPFGSRNITSYNPLQTSFSFV